MWSRSSEITTMTIAHDSVDHHVSLFDRLQAMSDGSRQPNLLLPGARFTLFAFAAIVAGAALAFVT
jgi:hypothetical protein